MKEMARHEGLRRLWTVKVRDIGSEGATNLYFETKEEAQKYADSRDRADEPIHKDFPQDRAWQMLASTDFYLSPEGFR